MLSIGEILLRLGLAALFGGFIGLERERKDWAAGLRTHMMVSVGSCLIMIVSSFGFEDILNLGRDNIALDPSRIAAQVVSGIGFIGAGTILFLKQGRIRGLTTAAGLWTVAAIGLATGGGMYFAAAATTVIALAILWALQPLEKVFSKKFKFRKLRIVAHVEIDSNELFKEILDVKGIKIHNFSLNRENDEYVFEFRFENVEDDKLNNMVSQLKEHKEIVEIDFN